MNRLFQGFICSILLILSVHGSVTAEIIYVLGDNGTILSITGEGCAVVPTGPGEAIPDYDYIDIWGSSPNDIYLLHPDHLIHFDGSSWNEIDLSSLLIVGDYSYSMRKIDGSSTNQIVISTDTYHSMLQKTTRLLFYDGMAWSAGAPFNGFNASRLCTASWERSFLMGEFFDYFSRTWLASYYQYTTEWSRIQDVDTGNFTTIGYGPMFVNWWSDLEMVNGLPYIL